MGHSGKEYERGHQLVPQTFRLIPKCQFGQTPDSANHPGNASRPSAYPTQGFNGGILNKRSAGEIVARLRSWFPDREFFMRSEGQVRFIKVSSRLQMAVAAGVGVLALGWVITVASVAIHRLTESYDSQSLLNREARVKSAESRVAAYRKGLGGVADDLKRRQDFIEKMVSAHLGALPEDKRAGETISDSGAQAASTVAKISASVPEAAGLARQEARQLAFVEQLTRYADRRAQADAEQMRHLGLNPDTLLSQMDRGEAMGGPLLSLSTSANGSLDPRFERLGLSMERMSALDNGIQRLPRLLPAKSDPFTHRGSFHPGLDFRGPIGAPIYAAAKGLVSFAGQKSGYGTCSEVTHGIRRPSTPTSGSRWPLGKPSAAPAAPPARTCISRCASTTAR